MKRSIASLVSAALIAAGLGGYWAAGIGLAPFGPVQRASGAERKTASGPVIYYRDPDGKPAYAESPAKTLDGRDFVAVHASEDIGFDKVQAATAAAAPAGGKRIRFYRNPMGLPDISPAPKKDSMGMDYTPVYEGEEPASDGSTVKISVEKVQRLGVRTEAAAAREIVRTVRAVSTVQADERRLHTVAPRFEGWIERLYINTTGQAVRKGDALMDVYSPELITAQQDYMIARQGVQAVADGSPEVRAGMQRLVDSALQRLRNWDISESELQQLQKEGKARQTITLRSAVSGVVL